MVKQSLTILALLTASTVAASAVGLADGPVREAMRFEVAGSNIAASDLWANLGSGEFEDEEDALNKPREATPVDQEKGGHKSAFKAALYSALVPGGGQYYLGHKRTARYFFAAEAATWIAYFSYHTYGNWREDDYIRYAAENANAQLEGKSDEFRTWVGFYGNIREFNTFGRVGDPERAYLKDTPENHWEWQSDADRRMYRDLRNGSKEAYRRADFMVVAAVVDRMISVIDAIRSASRMNRTLEDEGDSFTDRSDRKFHFSVDPLSSRQLCITLYPGF
jgi:hypothetical protein